jgi:hypothetical protein
MTPKPPRAGRPVKRQKKIARTFRLTEGKVEAAQRILGAPTATETIETALDLVVFRQEVVDAAAAAFGVRIRSPDAGRP